MRKVMKYLFLTVCCITIMGWGAVAKVTLVYSDWHLVEPVWEQSLKEAFAQFQKMYPDIEVVLDYVSLSEKTTKYATAMAAGKGPDIVHLQAHAELYPFMSRGYLLDLTPYIEQDDPEPVVGI